MAGRIHGITVTLFEKTQVGVDEFNRPVYNESPVEVENVLVGSPESDETISVANRLNLTGKKIAYVLAIPKGDEHDWMDRKVSFFGEIFRTVGTPAQGIEDMIPLEWNRKVKVERYEQEDGL